MPSLTLYIFYIQAGRDIEKTPINPSDLFSGEFLNTYSESSAVKENFMDISVPIINSATTLDKALAEYVFSENDE